MFLSLSVRLSAVPIPLVQPSAQVLGRLIPAACLTATVKPGVQVHLSEPAKAGLPVRGQTGTEELLITNLSVIPPLSAHRKAKATVLVLRKQAAVPIVSATVQCKPILIPTARRIQRVRAGEQPTAHHTATVRRRVSVILSVRHLAPAV